jgi:hypothetical protein
MYKNYVISLYEEWQIWVCEKKGKSDKRTQKGRLQNLKPVSIYQNYVFQQKLLQREYYPFPWRGIHS